MMLLFLLITVCTQGLEAIYFSGLQQDDVIYACQGSVVSLPWQIHLGHSDTITDIQWFYAGRSDEVLAVLTHGAFVAFPAFSGRVHLISSAGIALGPVVPADSGNYSVQVTGFNAYGQHHQLSHSVYVQISDHLMTQDGYLHVSQSAVPVLDYSTGQWTVQLKCGVFTFLGDPPFFVQWSTPDGTLHNSSSYDSGYFHYSLSGAVQTGTYKCRVPRQELNQSCSFGQDAADAEASLVVDGFDVRLTLLERENRQLRQEYQFLASENQRLSALSQQMARDIQGLDSYQGSIRLVGGRDEMEGRVEIRVGHQWGTICDDYWDDTDARVVCNMLGFFAEGAVANMSAAFGQGMGPIMLDDVQCNGTEVNIRQCSARPFGIHDCSHSEDAGVVCMGY